MNDLRGELGVKFQAIEHVVTGLQNNLSLNLNEVKDDFDSLQQSVTEATAR